MANYTRVSKGLGTLANEGRIGTASIFLCIIARVYWHSQRSELGLPPAYFKFDGLKLPYMFMNQNDLC